MIITKKYHSNLVTERRAHWSLKLGVACYPVTLHVNKKSKEEQRLVEEEERAKENKRHLKRLAEEREAGRRERGRQKRERPL